MRGWLKQGIRDMRSEPPCWREHSVGRAWYQLRGNKIYQHLAPGPIEEAVLIYTVLDMGELEDGMFVESSIRSIVIEVTVESTKLNDGKEEVQKKAGTKHNKRAASPKRLDAVQGAANDEVGDVEKENAQLQDQEQATVKGVEVQEEAKQASTSGKVECKIFYAASLDEAQKWCSALIDATDQDPHVPTQEQALIVWLANVSESLEDKEGRAAEQTREMLSCNATGLARVVVDSTPGGANALHVAARVLGNKPTLLEALTDACAAALLSPDDTSSLPLHVLLTYFPQETKSVCGMYGIMADINGGSAPAAADGKGATPLHTIARFFRTGGEDGQIGAGGTLARKCGETISGLLELRPEALRETDAKGRLPLHVMARHHGSQLSGMRMIVWKYPDAAQTPAASGWLPAHYVARFHGTAAARTLALLRSVGGEDTLSHYSKTGFLAIHLLARHGTSAEALKAVLTPDTALLTAPKSLTALHLLCLYQPAQHEIIKVCIKIQPLAARRAAEDGSLPLHILAKSSGAGHDASLHQVVSVFPPAAVATDNRGLIPLQLVPKGSRLRWTSHQLLQAISLRVQVLLSHTDVCRRRPGPLSALAARTRGPGV